jgi:putative ABC transport system permease protein
MIPNFFKTGFRSLRKNKSFAVINVTGLAVGIAASLLIFLVIHHETSYDDYHSKKNRIYRVVTDKINRSNGAIEERNRGVPNPLPTAFRQDFPGFEKTGALAEFGGAQIYVPGNNSSDPEKQFKQNEGLFFVQPEVFDIFDFTWLAGSPKGLTAPHTGVISEKLAKTWFGSTEAAIGKTVEFWSFRRKAQIVGVFKDIPSNSDIPVDMGVSFATLLKIAPNFTSFEGAWNGINTTLECFALLPEGHSIGSQAAQLPGFVKKYYHPDLNNKQDMALHFQPLSDIHLNKDYGTFKEDSFSIKELWSLGLIGAFLLLVACINFVNLATAQSINRSKEIGVRKVLGSNRYQLIQQFLQETGIITILAIVLGGMLAFLTLPMLNKLVEKDLTPNLWHYPAVLLFLVGIGIVVTLLAGFYPAMVISGFKPVMILKNKLNAKAVGGISLRRGLVVFQFVIAQLLVIGTIVVVKQMQFFRNHSVGFNKDGIALISLPSDSTLKIKYAYLEQRIHAIPGVQATGLCLEAPITPWSWQSDFYFNNNPLPQPFKISMQFGDTGYVNTFGLKLVAGRQPFYNDSLREVMVNETAVKKLGFQSPAEIIGKTISMDNVSWYSVTGVLRDYNNRTLHVEIKPIVLMAQTGNNYEYIAVRVQTAGMNNTFAQVQKVFKDVYPTYMWDPYFLDQRLEWFYKTEATTSQLFKIFAILAIFISCLGLYGLVSFMAVQKTKEIGIRKVLGASVQHIVYLFSREFTILIVLAFAVAAPIGYYFMNKWLLDFYYHINIGWGVFAIAMVASVVVAWITVGYKAVKAALVNPVKSLKTE